MDSGERLSLELRLMAIEYVVCEIGKVAFLAAGVTPDQVGEMRNDARAKLLAETFPGADPVLGDHVSAELSQLVEGLLNRVQDLLENSLRRKRQSEL